MAGMNSLVKILEAYENDQYDSFDGEKDEAIDFVVDAAKSLPEYVNRVVNQQIILPTLRFRFEGEEYREHVMELDKSRRNAHECAISGISMLNRQCAKFGIEPFADIDTNDRYAVANFAGKFTNDLFNQGQGNEQYEQEKNVSRNTTFDNAVAQGEKQGGYDYNSTGAKIMSAYDKLKIMKSKGDNDVEQQSEAGLQP